MKFPKFSLGVDWKELRKFEKLDLNKKRVVFYAENNASFNHFRLLIEELTKNRNISICYVTSVKKDRIFDVDNEKILSFYIGKGTARTKFFLTLSAKMLVMDMPDFDRFHIKRSKMYPVHYIYLFHSMFSIHSYLRHGALDNFDTIFCVGPHHINEIRETEKIYELKQKYLINYGYGRLDWLLDETKKFKENDKQKIIIAPSYGEKNLLEMCGIDLIDILLDSNFKIILRPHFRILKDSKKLIECIKKKYKNNPNFFFEEGVIKQNDYHSSEYMITDWSGIGMEYALAREQKVIFIDTPRKIMNAKHSEISLKPVEIEIREKIGIIVSPNDLHKIPNIIKKNEKYIKNISSIRSQLVFNIGRSAIIGADYIERKNKDK